MRDAVPPPMPDPNTGEPRPPAAPRTVDTVEGERAADPGSLPAGPQGKGPVLEWYRESGSAARRAAVVTLVVLLLAVSLVFGGMEWAGIWWVWLLVLAGPVLVFASTRATTLLAGADWLHVNGATVATYELDTVRLSGSAGGLYLDLRDTGGGEVGVRISDLQKNDALWDLVYNGILHSLFRGPVRTNEQARAVLELPHPPERPGTAPEPAVLSRRGRATATGLVVLALVVGAVAGLAVIGGSPPAFVVMLLAVAGISGYVGVRWLCHPG